MERLGKITMIVWKYTLVKISVSQQPCIYATVRFR